ncbi:MAG: helix-turn-helix transcriptional regulator [Bacteroidales bacterium]|nr:helix-turn-helix transcriptional regulator [Bacteroidales bacterium]
MVDLKVIKILCNEAGITLKKLSDKTKISQTAITMAMQRNSTTLETLEKIAKYFHVSVGVFFGEKDIFTPIRDSFEKFDIELQKANNYVNTTLLYYNPELKNPVSLDTLVSAFEKLPLEAVKIVEYTMKKVVDNPVYQYLMKFSYNEILQMKHNGILAENTVDFLLSTRNADFFEEQNLLVQLEGESEPNFWEKLQEGIADYRKNHCQNDVC